MRPCLRTDFRRLPCVYSFPLWPEQRFDRAALVHRAIALSHPLERQDQVEHLSRIDRSGKDEIDQVRQVPAHWRWTAEQAYVTEEEIGAIEPHPVRNADVADRSARSRRPNRLLHRLLGANALEDRVGADAVRQLLDPLDAFVPTFGDDIRGAEFARELLAGFMPAHRNDPFGAHLLRREHAEEPDRA